MAEPRFDLHGYLQALQARDAEGMLAYLAEDLVFTDLATGEQTRGKAVVRLLLEEYLPAIADVDTSILLEVQEGNRVAALAVARVTYRDDVEMAGTRWPTRGRSVEVPVAFFGEVDSQGKLRTGWRVRDLWSSVRQLGMGPEVLLQLATPGEAPAPGAPGSR